MKILLILTCFFAFNSFWEIVSLIIAVLALVISVGFVVRPKLRCSIYYLNNKIRVKLYNVNLFRKLITDIHCEMSLSDDSDFSGMVRTLELQKDWIICLMRSNGNEVGPYYVFRTKVPLNPIDRTHLRVRFLIPNFIGIKKAYEVIVPVNEFRNQSITMVPNKPK